MFKNRVNAVRSLLLGGALTVAAAPAFAVIDVTGAVATFGEIETAVPLIGAAFLGALGLMAAWKLARGLFA